MRRLRLEDRIGEQDDDEWYPCPNADTVPWWNEEGGRSESSGRLQGESGVPHLTRISEEGQYRPKPNGGKPCHYCRPVVVSCHIIPTRYPTLTPWDSNSAIEQQGIDRMRQATDHSANEALQPLHVPTGTVKRKRLTCGASSFKGALTPSSTICSYARKTRSTRSWIPKRRRTQIAAGMKCASDLAAFPLTHSRFTKQDLFSLAGLA